MPSVSASGATEIVRQMALAERKYQEELNRGFAQLSEGAFKGLRRQLPVTRQKVEWEKIGTYRVSAVHRLMLFVADERGSWGRILGVGGRGRGVGRASTFEAMAEKHDFHSSLLERAAARDPTYSPCTSSRR